MQKEFAKQQKIEHLDDQQKKEFEEKIKLEDEAKKHHKPVNVDSFNLHCRFGFEFRPYCEYPDGLIVSAPPIWCYPS